MGGGIAIAAIFICLWAPVVLLAGYVGLLVDRMETRSLLLVVSAGQAVVAVGLALLHSQVLLYVLAALLGVGIAVAQAAEFALIPVVAGGRPLQKANGTVETARALGFTLGPLCGGLLVAAGGITAAMLVDAASFVVVGLAALSLSPCAVPAAPRRRASRAAHATGSGSSSPTRRRPDGRRRLRLAPLHVRVDPRRPRLRRGRPAASRTSGSASSSPPGPSGMLIGSNVVGRRIPLAALATADDGRASRCRASASS